MPLPRRAFPLTLIALAALSGACRRDDPSGSEMANIAGNTTQSPPQSASSGGMAAMDSDSDGILTRDEHAAAAAAMFDTMDADKDGNVTAAEMDGAQSALGGSTALSSADKIKMVDANRDGLLSRQEHVEGSKSMFARMDGDSSGTLSRTEFDAGHKAMLGE